MKKVILFFLCIFASTFSFAQWTWQNPLPTGNDLRSVQFVNANTGYIVGDNGEILKTINGGQTWTSLTIETNNSLK